VEGLSLRGARIALHGNGTIGFAAAQVMAEWGAIIVAIGDGRVGIHREAGLDVGAAMRYYDEHESLHGCPYGTAIPGASLTVVPCDILVLSGAERVDERVARTMPARMIVEGDFGTIAPEADEVLESRGIVVLPDILGGSGGAAASYFEWVQDIQETFWSEADINERLEEILLRAFGDVVTRRKRDGISLRLAAHALAVERVADAHRIRGLYP
jgi:glutamate dehydrogenase (NAD(P)+)